MPREAPMPGARENLGLPPLAVLALMVVASFIPAFLLAQPYANPDAHAFEALARALLLGNGLAYREPMLPWLELRAFRSPGYPVFLAPWLALGGVRLALAVNGALVAWTAVQAGELVSRVASRRAGRLAFALAIVWPAAWITAGQLMSETLFVALSATAMRVTLDAMATRRARVAVFAGVLVAASLLTRPVGVALLVAGALGLVLRAPRAAVAFVLAVLLAWAPWPLRNLRELGSPVPFTTSAGLNLADGVTPGPVSDLWTEMSGWRPLGELAIDGRWRTRYRAALQGNPRGQAIRSAREMVLYVVPLDRGPEQWLHRAIAFLALAGLALTVATPPGLALGAAWLGQGAINSMASVNARYRFPSEWLVVVFAALAVETLRRRFGDRRAWLATGALVGLGLLACVAQLLRPR